MKKPKLPKTIKRPFKRAKAPEERVAEAFANVPKITNETVAEHREEVLSSARKYIYPLKHSKHRVVRTSIALFVLVVVVFFVYCGLALYKFQSTSSFMYGVTQVIPFPIAKDGPSWISYDSYLFELRRNMHYYQTQQNTDFSTKSGRVQLARLKQQAIAQVIEDALVKQLAAKNKVSVTDGQVNSELTLVRSENRLGDSNRVFNDVLNQFWGWNQDDFKRELKQQLLQQAVVAKLDIATNQRAQAALQQLKSGASFATVAAQYSDDIATKSTGGLYTSPITANDQSIPAQLISAIFKLQPNGISPIIDTGYSLEIVKMISQSDGSAQAAHIQFNLEPVTAYTLPLQQGQKLHKYLKV